MRPYRIVIVRHAEKPAKHSEPHLALRGDMRALGLSKILPKFVKPDYIFASTSTKNSKRPYQTIHPTAKKLGMKVCTKFADKDTKKFAKELKRKKYSRKTILVCWHHGEIPRLIQRLGLMSPYNPWPPTLFDRIIDMGDEELGNLPQRLLFGDSEK
jgi:hypothetical protein